MVLAFTQTNRAHVELRANKQSNVIYFSVDGRLLQTWTDTNGFAGVGSGLRFVHNGSGLIKLSNLRVTPWDGILEDASNGAAGAGLDQVSLLNASILTGVIEKIVDGTITLRGQRDKAEIPMAKVLRLTFAQTPADANPPAEELIRGLFPGGGSLMFQLENWSAEGVELRSPVFGQARFSPDAFIRLMFPTHREPAKK
jgi:hypothetical protein